MTPTTLPPARSHLLQLFREPPRGFGISPSQGSSRRTSAAACGRERTDSRPSRCRIPRDNAAIRFHPACRSAFESPQAPPSRNPHIGRERPLTREIPIVPRGPDGSPPPPPVHGRVAPQSAAVWSFRRRSGRQARQSPPAAARSVIRRRAHWRPYSFDTRSACTLPSFEVLEGQAVVRDERTPPASPTTAAPITSAIRASEGLDGSPAITGGNNKTGPAARQRPVHESLATT